MFLCSNYFIVVISNNPTHRQYISILWEKAYSCHARIISTTSDLIMMWEAYTSFQCPICIHVVVVPNSHDAWSLHLDNPSLCQLAMPQDYSSQLNKQSRWWLLWRVIVIFSTWITTNYLSCLVTIYDFLKIEFKCINTLAILVLNGGFVNSRNLCLSKFRSSFVFYSIHLAWFDEDIDISLLINALRKWLKWFEFNLLLIGLYQRV